ncbi:hypothetical protein E1A91_D07G026400v1 [Gossypium mustelinum]|uniref:Early nodulin 93 ENOD93 protein n=6 Tax=Gossypium TaxID=3633 RepID=A0A5D2U333_GOSMU|nr:hypothetical protein E1A91_D07G026400v1 [Gossypium mustelinum]TYI71967.1 hypothetical protein E1A91_D07G026400v1 [Gossypium mustelinum]
MNKCIKKVMALAGSLPNQITPLLSLFFKLSLIIILPHLVESNLYLKKMGIPSEMRDVWVQRRAKFFIIPSPAEDQKKLRAQQSSQEGIRAGLKAAAITGVFTAVPTLIAVRKVAWAKANLNHTAQALIISGASIAAYFITVDKTVLESARKNSRAQFDNKTA